MTVKTPPTQQPLMCINLAAHYDTFLLLPFKEASQLVLLLEKAQTYVKDYSKEETHIRSGLKEDMLKLTSMDMEVYAQIRTANLLGITYKDYLEQVRLKEIEDANNASK